MKPDLRAMLVPVALLLFLAVYPQLAFWLNGGTTGSYFVTNYDEPAYSAYVNSLVEGKPRRNDPFTQTASSTPESLYSIQFVPAYAIAIPARVTGISTSTAFIILSALIALFSFCAMYWLMRESTGHAAFAAVASFAILVLGTAAAFQGELRSLLTGGVLLDFFPFLRRYQPGLGFPLFLVLICTFWKAVNVESQRRRLVYACVSGILFCILVFSYFYLWTAAAAWLGLLTLIGIVADRSHRGRYILSGVIVGLIAAGPLVAYFRMLGARSADLDAAQLLTRTHAPEFDSATIFIGLIVLAILAAAAYKKLLPWVSPVTLLCGSLALVPLVLFNQQIITGISLQPVHYEIFVANYLVLTAAAILIFQLVETRLGGEQLSRVLVYVMCAAAVWGFVESSTAATRDSAAASVRDRSVPAIKLVANSPGSAGSVVLATNFVTSDIIPTVAPLRAFWNAHSSSAGGLSQAENKRLFYLFLYFSGYKDTDLAQELRANTFEVKAAVFGSDRALPTLAGGAKSVTTSDIQTEIRAFDDFVAHLDRSTALSPAISYLIVPNQDDVDMTNVDRWYERDQGTDAGLFRVYKLAPRP